MTATALPTTRREEAYESSRDPRVAGVTGPGEIVTEFDRPPAEIVERLAQLPIANISDAMNKHGVLHYEVRPLQPGARVCGPALTCGSVDLTVKIVAQSLVQPGDVFVLAAGGVRDYACLGELSANMLVHRGAAGAVVDGAVRDLAGIRDTGLTVFARAVTPRNYHYPFGQPYGSVNLPVVCGGIVVNPGDVVVAGDDGVAIVPRRIAAEVAAAAEQIERHESSYRTAIGSGQWSADAFEQELRAAGYVIR
jgi:4-hydroxy-4-methyl-2-oxoglutarate aldolase